ncbi:MAG: glycosyltransferase [Oligoflexia bacterium]|nr:glycosyltransferase [Oligoflexia bacterium]
MVNSRYLLINSFTSGGAERQASYLVKRSFFKKVFTILPENNYEVDPAIIEVIGNSLYRKSSIFKLLFIPYLAIKLVKNISKEAEVISFLEISNYINIIAKLLNKNIKSIISVRTVPSQQYRGMIGKVHHVLIKLLYPRADVVVVNSNGAKLDLVENFGIIIEKIKVINNAYDAKEIIALSEEALESGCSEFFKSNNVICMSGRFTQGKGQEKLIEIYNSVKNKVEKCKLAFIGEGELLEKALSYCIERNIKYYLYTEDSAVIPEDVEVLFMGFRKNPFSIIKNSKVFAFPSMWEGYPNVLAETLILNIPIISADCPFGPREVLTLKNGKMCGELLPHFSLGMDTNEEKRLIDLWSNSIIKHFDEGFNSELFAKSKDKVEEFDQNIVLERWAKI